METLTNALVKAQNKNCDNMDWEILSTRSGGWSLQRLGKKAATVNFLKYPCRANLGEADKPYLVNAHNAIRNFASLDEALDFAN